MRRSAKELDPGKSVQLDWFKDLALDKDQAFQKHALELESSYLMFSVTLNEAIGLHQDGFVKKSLEVIAIASTLCRRLAKLLENVLRSLSAYCLEHGTDPSISPLNLTDFQGDRSRLTVLKSLIRHRTLLKHRSQFQNKIRSLIQIVRSAGLDFCASSGSVAADGILADSKGLWSSMDQDHFDLNTSLRESLILLKCFLQVLPSNELRCFEEGIARCPTHEPAPKARAATVGRLTTAPHTSLKWS